jgi:ADP-ribose pyrophosphatase
MSSQFKWLEVKVEYREIRASAYGEEQRWLVSRETILNTETGQTITRATIRHPGICVMVPFVDDDRIVLMRQYRYSIDDALWELPAGTLNGREENERMVATETPAECAARELLEETGYEAGQLEKVCECYAMPGYNDEIIHVFFARDLTLRQQQLDIGEVIHEIKPFSLAEIEAMIRQGEIRDAKTLIGLFYALNRRPDGARIAPR